MTICDGIRAHTPGPWRVDEDSDPPRVIGRPIWPCRRSGVEGEWEVAELDDFCGDHADEILANARLIAAAPTMADFVRKHAAAGDEEAIQIMRSIDANA